jgi:hypothetical protein
MSDEAVRICKRCGYEITHYQKCDDPYLHFGCKQEIESELYYAKIKHDAKLREIEREKEREERNLPKKKY